MATYPQNNPVQVRPMSDYYKGNGVLHDIGNLLSGGFLGEVTGDNRAFRDAAQQRQMDMQTALQEETAKRQAAIQALMQRQNEAVGLGINPQQFGDDQIALAAEVERRKLMREDLANRNRILGANAAQMEATGKNLGVNRQTFFESSLPGNEARIQETDEQYFPRVSAEERRLKLEEEKAQAASRNEGATTAVIRNAKLLADVNGLKADTPEYNDFIRNEVEYQLLPTTDKSAHLIAKQQVASGLIKPDQFKQERARLIAFGGRPPQLSASQEQALAGDNTLVQNLDVLQKEIEAFNQDYPQTPFSSFVGPVDKRTLDFKLMVTPGSPQEKRAARIQQLYQEALNVKIKDNSGASTSAQEILRNLAASGELTNANFENALQGWKDNAATVYSNRLAALDSFAIPESLKTIRGRRPEEFIGSKSRAGIMGQPGGAAANPAPAPAAPAGGNQSLQDLAAAELARRRGAKR